MSKKLVSSDNSTRGGINHQHISGLVSLILSLSIAGVAAVFSITGLADMFASAFWPVVAMGVVLEAGKLRAAGWLHGNWSTAGAGRILRFYAFCAVGLLMALNAVGVYGFLSRAYLAPSANNGSYEAQIASFEAKISAERGVIATAQSDAAQKSALARAYEMAHYFTKASAQIAAQGLDEQRMSQANIAIAADVAAEIPIRAAISASVNRAGPIQFVAAALGLHGTDTAARIIITMIVLAFDPLAVVLMIAATISFDAASQMNRTAIRRQAAPRRRAPEVVVPPVLPAPETRPPGARVVPITTPTPKLRLVDDKAQLDLFAERPRLAG